MIVTENWSPVLMPRLPLAAFAVETIASAEVAQASAKIFFIVCPFSSAYVVMRWHLKCLINAVLRNKRSRYTRIIIRLDILLNSDTSKSMT